MGKRRKVEVEAVPADAGSPPFVCYFPTGAPSTSSAAGTALEFSMFSRNAGRNMQHVLVGSRERIDYVGTTNGPDYSAPQPCSYAVGVYDKASGKLQLLPLQGGKVCRMEARLHGLDYGPSENTNQEASTREERLELNKRLVGSFGSTRRRRQLDAREEGIVRSNKLASTDALTQVLQQQAAEAAKQGVTKDQVLQRATQVRNLPPHHPEANTPSEAYRLHELIPPAVRDCLDVGRLFKAAQSSEALDKLKSAKLVPEYVQGRLHLLLDPAKAKQQATILAFLGALLNLLEGRPELRVDPERGGMNMLAQRHHMQPGLLAELLELFYNRRMEGNMEVYDRPAQKKELLLAYVLVLVQLLEGGGLAAPQFEALRQELKMKPSDLLQRFREVGSTCMSTSFKAEDGNGESEKVRSYDIVMLKDGKTLAECFPGIKVGPKRK